MLFTTALLALSSALTVSAFTNGSLVPAYMCNPTPDGLPKNYGQVLALTRKQVRKLAFTANSTSLSKLFASTFRDAMPFWPAASISSYIGRH